MLHILSNVLVMSKQPIAEEGGDFWKKIRYSATATAAIGAGLFAITSVIKKQGFVSNLVDEMQAAMHAAPQLLNEPPNTEVSKPGFQTPADDAETRAILETQLHPRRVDARELLVDLELHARLLDRLGHAVDEVLQVERKKVL